MPYALRSTVNSDELEIAEILMSLSKPATRSSYDSDSDSEYVPDADDEMDVVSVSDDDDEEYVPADDDEDADGDDEEVADVDEDSDEIRKAIVRQACSSISRGIAIPRPFWRLISLTKNNRVSVQFKKWMLGIPPVKSIYASFASLH